MIGNKTKELENFDKVKDHTVQEYTSLAAEVNNRLLRVRTVAGRNNEANETITNN